MKVAIIGGGAAGIMAAAAICETDPSVKIFLIEKNESLGKKVVISGGGRCNVTTGIRDIRTVLTKYPRGGKFLSSSMHKFPPEAVYNWFENHGVPLKIEEDFRVFPKSDNGKDIVNVFDKIFATSNVKILIKTQVIRVEKFNGGFNIFLKTQDNPLFADKLIITTGGEAYRQTGSSGDGYGFAVSLGHSITRLAPSLNAFFTKENWPTELSGVSFVKAKLNANAGKNPSFTGPFLFTHRGLSGPAVFALSSLVAFETCDPKKPLKISIDFLPDIPLEELKRQIKKNITGNPRKKIINIIAGLLPKSVSEIICRQLSFDKEKNGSRVLGKEIDRLALWIKNASLNVIGRGAGDEFVTAGGIDLKEVNPTTMESKICPNLYFAGEILDIDGFTGGFNLQASWATGELAGNSAVK